MSFALQIELPDEPYRALQQTATDLNKSEAEVATVAIEVYLRQSQSIDPLLGLFADEADLIDAITADAMLSREQTPHQRIQNAGYTGLKLDNWRELKLP